MNSPIRVLLVDDEQPCRDALRIFLSTGCPEVNIVGEAISLAEACQLIPLLSPNVIL